MADTPPATAGRIDFARDIEPLLRTRCQGCHGPRQQMSGLRLDGPADAMRGGSSGPVIQPGKSGESKLIQMVSGAVEGRIMPPAGARLTSNEIGLLRAWIDQGAVWPVTAKVLTAGPSGSTHWSFQPIVRPGVPSVRKSDWARNPIDAFVLAKLESEGIPPSPEADKRKSVRRVSLDLTGLPPTPGEIEEFLADNRADAYERLVDKKLQSPHYGEKWARYWLDLARYADSDGYEKDNQRPHAWRYRHWVIEALNRDMPFDLFTLEQIAGDLLPDSTVDQKVATGFHRNTLTNREGGVNVEQFRFEQVVDRASTVGTVWLGLTVGCAQCHDHKFDPISQKEFYQLFAYFNTADEVNIEAPLPGERGPYLQAFSDYYAKRHKLLSEYHVTERQPEWERKMLDGAEHPGKWTDLDVAFDTVQKMVDHGERILRTPVAKRSRYEQDAITDHLVEWYAQVVGNKVYKELAFKELQKKLYDLKVSFPDLSQAQTISESSESRKTHVAIRGDYRQNGIEVQPGIPAILHAGPSTQQPTRLTLAQWLISPRNPLTARVMVNRFWQELFGQGIVTTPDDFGAQGAKPSHPELLDWLAAEFMDGGWSMKRMHKLIVMSASYRQSANARPDLDSRDPYNVLLARQTPFRLPAELIRDTALSASGLLYEAIGGKSVQPHQPESVSKLAFGNNDWVKWEDSQGRDRYRRGVYIHFQRTMPYPLLMNFDAPDASVASCRRQRSDTPLQALNLLNDPVFLETAQALAERILREAPGTFQSRLDYGFELCLARKADSNESERLLNYFQKQRAILKQEPQASESLFPVDLAGIDRVEAAAWVGVSRVILNLDEFLTRE
ncbi:MAG: PSD1 and planctomycete cytochrome C domain-containing protein [Bryobacteraceae bacterium]